VIDTTATILCVSKCQICSH